jgi:hypothetical protein
MVTERRDWIEEAWARVQWVGEDEPSAWDGFPPTDCPECGCRGELRYNWHIVASSNGRALCDACLGRVDPALVSLCEALDRHDKMIQRAIENDRASQFRWD